jgi:hypothetical protein
MLFGFARESVSDEIQDETDFSRSAGTALVLVTHDPEALPF